MRKETELIIINNVKVPAPDVGYEIIESDLVDAGRNTKGVTVGQRINTIWKINNLQWSSLTADEWAALKRALKPFYVPVTFTNDYNERVTLTMYPGDRKATPMRVTATNTYGRFSTCKFNLIDTGKR